MADTPLTSANTFADWLSVTNRLLTRCQQASVTLNHAQILALANTAVLIVSAPAVDALLFVESAVFDYRPTADSTYTGAAYQPFISYSNADSSPTLTLSNAGGSAAQFNVGRGINIAPGIAVAPALANIGSGLYVFGYVPGGLQPGDEPAGGNADDTLIVTVFYTVY